ncbi:MAG: hypothetical protein J5723_01010 [Ruminococcus sp.]|nr:hypothetical protein [Ruminococcus sp.]
MKKVQFIGALLAAVIAAAPATGLASIPAFNNNAIVSEAATTKPSVIMVEPGNYYKDIFGYKLDGSAIMQNGDWSLIGDKNGSLYTYNSKTKQKKPLFDSPYNSNSKYPGTNVIMKDFKLCFQCDGNIVCYANNDVKKPVYHSCTYSSLTCANSKCSYYYFLESDGRLVIKRLYNGSVDITFDSSRCNFVRLV